MTSVPFAVIVMMFSTFADAMAIHPNRQMEKKGNSEGKRIKSLIFVFALHKTGSTLFNTLLREGMIAAGKKECHIDIVCMSKTDPCPYLDKGRNFYWGFLHDRAARCEDLVIFSRNLPTTIDENTFVIGRVGGCASSGKYVLELPRVARYIDLPPANGWLGWDLNWWHALGH